MTPEPSVPSLIERARRLLPAAWDVRQTDALTALRGMPDDTIHCVMTSPPYYQQRSYDGLGPDQLGLERDPWEYVAHLVEIFREVRRVLHPSGTVWVNLGTAYAGSGRGPTGWNGIGNQTKRQGFHSPGAIVPVGFKPKDQIPIPAMFLLAMQQDGWWYRSDVIWHKPNPLPNSYEDRPITAHEYVLLFSASRRYFYDHVAVRTAEANLRDVWSIATKPSGYGHYATFPEALVEPCIRAGTSEWGVCPRCGAPWERVVDRVLPRGTNPAEGRREHERVRGTTPGRDNRGIALGGDLTVTLGRPTVYTTTGWQPTCKKGCAGGTPVPATVLDPFCGIATSGVVARKLGRRYIGIELVSSYAEEARKRIGNVSKARQRTTHRGGGAPDPTPCAEPG